MYQYNLKITILSENKDLENLIKLINPMENFSHSIQRFTKLETNLEKFLNSDILLIDFTNFSDLKEETFLNIKNSIKKDTKIICLTSQNYNAELLPIVDEIILNPLDYRLILQSFTKILKKIKLEEDLWFTKNCLNTIINGTPDMFWIKSVDGIHTQVNKTFCNIVGKKKQDVIGKDHYSIWNVSKNDPNSGADTCKKTEDKVIELRHTCHFQERVKSPDGSMRELTTYKTPLYDKYNNILGTIGFGQDITAFQNLNIKYKNVFDSYTDAVLIRDESGKIRSINKNFKKYFKVSKETIIGKDYEEWAKETFKPKRIKNAEGFFEGTTFPIGGKEKIVELRFNNFYDNFGNILGQTCTFRDMTLVRKLEAENTRKSNTDYMTGLYNRRYLDQFISEQNRKETITIFAIDLDHFKSVNDTYGHKMGDEAIILAANIFKENFPNDLTVRTGGDEFIIVKIGDVSNEELEEDAQALLDSLKRNFTSREEFCNLSASIGIAKDTLEKGIDNLLKYSDAALYEVKKRGRGCYYLYKKSEEILVRKLKKIN